MAVKKPGAHAKCLHRALILRQTLLETEKDQLLHRDE